MFDRFRKKAAPVAELKQPEVPLIAKYKQMLPEFTNFKKTISEDPATLAEQCEKKAEALNTLISVSISKETPEVVISILGGAGLEVLEHAKLKTAQANLYKLASSARMHYALDILEGNYWGVDAVKKMSGDQAASQVLYSTVKEAVSKSGEDARMAGDNAFDISLNGLRFKLHMIQAKDHTQYAVHTSNNAIIATSYLAYQEKGTNRWNDGKRDYFIRRINQAYNSKDQIGNEDCKVMIGHICDMMLDNAVEIGLLTPIERELIPRESGKLSIKRD